MRSTAFLTTVYASSAYATGESAHYGYSTFENSEQRLLHGLNEASVLICQTPAYLNSCPSGIKVTCKKNRSLSPSIFTAIDVPDLPFHIARPVIMTFGSLRASIDREILEALDHLRYTHREHIHYWALTSREEELTREAATELFFGASYN